MPSAGVGSGSVCINLWMAVDDLCKTAPNLCALVEMLGIPVAARGYNRASTGKNAIHTLCTTRKTKIVHTPRCNDSYLI